MLVGPSGAGKTTVGRLLAERLGCAFVDLDAEIEAGAGATVADIFRSDGEADFRAREEAVTKNLTLAEPTVVAAGGGWMVRPELRDRWPGAVRVWLQVSPALAVRRLGEGRDARPLLAGADPRARAADLSAERLPAYALSEYRVRTDGLGPDEVVEHILDLLAGRASTGGTTT